MSNTTPIRMAFIGCGGMSRHHMRRILPHFPNTEVTVVCEPSAAAYAETIKVFEDVGREPPPNEPNLARLLIDFRDRLAAAFIITPHVHHHAQATACLEADLDVLLEKPMVMSAGQALDLIETQSRTGRTLVVSFQGSLSPQVRTAVSMLRSGKFGPILTISGTIWQNWTAFTDKSWRQQPEISGGGFMFDSGAHMLNTVADLAGEDFVEVAAWFDNQSRPVEILGVVIGRLRSGALISLNAVGNTIPSCASDIRVYCPKAIFRTGAWGERLDIQRDKQNGWESVPVPASLGVWEQFLAVRSGVLPNPSPPEVGLRMAYLWDAIKASAEQNGRPVRIRQPGASL